MSHRTGFVELPRATPASFLASQRASFRATMGETPSIMVVNPETPGHMLRLSGVFADDGAKGIWVADSPLGGGGTFTVRHHNVE